MSDAQEMERFFRERGFGQLIGWGDSPALLVIDFTRAFTDPALPLGSNLDRELAETVRVLGSARRPRSPSTTRPCATRTRTCGMRVSGPRRSPGR